MQNANSLPATKRKAWLLAFSVISLLYVGHAGRNLLAAIRQFQAQSQIETWEYKTQQESVTGVVFNPPATELHAAQTSARAAASLSPRNPDILQTLADTLFWEMKNHPLPPSKHDEMLSAYREAIHLRPTWPDTYLRFARAKMLTGEFDRELDSAMAQTRKLGPWKPNLIYEMTELGLAHWERLGTDARNQIVKTIDSAQHWQLDEAENNRNSVAIWNLVVAHGRKADICALLPQDNPRTIRFCSGQATTTSMPVQGHT